MKKLLVFLCSLLFVSTNYLLVNGLPLNDLTPFPKAKWTVAVYMNGDNELEPSITGGEVTNERYQKWFNPNREIFSVNQRYVAPGDFHTELASPGSNEDIHVVALIDRTPGYASNMDDWTNTRLYYIRNGDYPDDTRSLFWTNTSSLNADELNMADTDTLNWFLDAVEKYFPSDRLYLSLWDHNWAWHSGYLQKDETSQNDTMNYVSLGQMVKNRQLENKKRIDVIGYDACVGANIEVLHTWRPIADNFAGSQDYVGWGGVNYSAVLTSLQSNPEMSPIELSVVIAESMLSDPQDKCASSLTLDAVNYDRVVQSIDSLACILIDQFTSLSSQLHTLRQNLPHVPDFASDTMHLDLWTVAGGLSSSFPENSSIQAAAKNLLDALEETVTYNTIQIGRKSCKDGHGVSIYWPMTKQQYEKDYQRLSFAKDTKWEEFLSLFLH